MRGDMLRHGTAPMELIRFLFGTNGYAGHGTTGIDIGIQRWVRDACYGTIQVQKKTT